MELLIIVLLVVCQAMQAFHFHFSAAPSHERAVRVATDNVGDAACPVCWAHQVVGAPVPQSDIVVVADGFRSDPTDTGRIGSFFFTGGVSPRGPPTA